LRLVALRSSDALFFLLQHLLLRNGFFLGFDFLLHILLLLLLLH
jgi:hypothetical protein